MFKKKEEVQKEAQKTPAEPKPVVYHPVHELEYALGLLNDALRSGQLPGGPGALVIFPVSSLYYRISENGKTIESCVGYTGHSLASGSGPEWCTYQDVVHESLFVSKASIDERVRKDKEHQLAIVKAEQEKAVKKIETLSKELGLK